MELGSDPTEINSTNGNKPGEMKKENVFKKPHKIINIVIPSHYGKLKLLILISISGDEDH